MIKKISDYFSPIDGVFSHMEFDFEFMSKEELNILFYANYGEKNPGPIVTKFLSLPPINDEVKNLSHMIESLYSVKWNKLKELTKIEYDPIHNYKDKLTEVITETGENNATQDLSSENNRNGTTTKDNTRTDDLSNTVGKKSTSTVTSNTDDGVYGFNSTDSSNSDTSTTEETVNEDLDSTITSTGTQKNGGSIIEDFTDSKTLGATKTSNSNNERTRESTHEGNIGNLTTQQMMKQEIELWKWNFIQNVLADVNDFLTIPIYLS